MNRSWIFTLCMLAAAAQAQPPAEEILHRVDAVMTSETKIVVSKMIIHGRRSTRIVEAKSYIDGTRRAFTEYLAPPREAGTKMLKLEDQLWTFSPQTDRIIKISGHMLRQSVMGSDLSYEDMMEDPQLANLYHAVLLGEESIGDRPCWILQLEAKTADIAYPSRKIWVDKERYLVLKEQRFAKGGRLLKTATVEEVKLLDGRWTPVRARFKDELQSGEGTEFIIESIQYNAAIPEHLFTKAALRR
ncbi:MAG: outer membrane lipoprotein-sorting protein [candidate division KSB1 bacterium]|nr:outer membrane lipoprotein-sorting protein [candidate division KSB1 bacterium]MDZ7347174.1 outer membrane lipoprotein-sorting protein [candidate division KSB1 bacterium]